MKSAEFKEVFRIAQAHEYDDIPYTECCWKQQALIALEGIALDKERRVCTKKQAAFVLNWQAHYFNGDYDMEEVARMKEYYKRVDLLD